jgi:hypothetical protein
VRVAAPLPSPLPNKFSLLEAAVVRSIVLITIVLRLGDSDIVVLSSSPSRRRKTTRWREWLAEVIAAEVFAVDVLAAGWWWKLITGLVELAERSAVKGIKRGLTSHEAWPTWRCVTVVFTLSLPLHDRRRSSVKVRRAHSPAFHLRAETRLVIMIASVTTEIFLVRSAARVSSIKAFVGVITRSPTPSHVWSVIFIAVAVALTFVVKTTTIPTVGHDADWL